MSFFEQDNNQNFEFNTICKEIWNQKLIVLPVPEPQTVKKTYVEIGIYFHNPSWKSFRFNPIQTIIPQVMTLEGQVIPRFYTSNEPSHTFQINAPPLINLKSKLAQWLSRLTKLFEREDYLIVNATETRAIYITVSLFWQNDQLLVEFNIPEFSYRTFAIYWFYNLQSLEKYQLRFIYLPVPKFRDELSKGEGITKQENELSLLATPFINLHLVQPTKTEANAVEIDGICFETIIPEDLLLIPEKSSKMGNSLQIGMKITNNTQIPIRFNLFATLKPELVSADGQALQKSYYCHGLQSPKKSDYPLAMPGASVSYFLNAKLFWFKPEQLRLEIAAGDGGFWIFDNLEAGVYQYRFIYNQHNAEATINDQKVINTKSLEWVSKTVVPTPFVELYVVSTSNLN
ncbi:hypothetical protein H6G96_33520 [Nostoc sp. FACHB-892]|uniref:hypothetical protein n=1 Tax=Nostoc sp. FACHB-892 TaxID=2692843 RepID=UPI001682423B|nr:hypothetical protein [Nostoc sp. FACHB-892]MBD2731105.1 hypothetical protein [Nostoc sp. FACHB-892]